MYSVRYYELKSEMPDLGVGEEVTTSHQKAFEGIADDAPHTKLKFLGSSENEFFNKYLIIYEHIVEVHGRYQNQPIRYYIAEEEIEVYKHRDENFIIAKGRGPTVRAALDALKADKKLNFVNYEVDILSLKRDLKEGNIKGAWFGDLNQANVETAGIFGTSVDQSDLWDELESTGNLKAVVIEVDRRSFMITRSGVIVMYKPWDERYSLEEVLEVVEVIRHYFII